MKKQIPNILTLCNLVSGCVAITMAFQGAFGWVVFWVIVATVFDFFDGFTARLLGVSSKMGVELDSLADVSSFGVAPATAVFVLLRDFTAYPAFVSDIQHILPYTAFLIPAFSAYRLAKFNLDDRQTVSFWGLPTPANALFWISYVYGIAPFSPTNANLFYGTIGFIILLSVLLVSEIPMFSLKTKTGKGWKSYFPQMALSVLMVVFVAIWGVMGIAVGIIAYIAISIFYPSTRYNR